MYDAFSGSFEVNPWWKEWKGSDRNWKSDWRPKHENREVFFYEWPMFLNNKQLNNPHWNCGRNVWIECASDIIEKKIHLDFKYSQNIYIMTKTEKQIHKSNSKLSDNIKTKLFSHSKGTHKLKNHGHTPDDSLNGIGARMTMNKI